MSGPDGLAPSWAPLPAHARPGGAPLDEDEAADAVLAGALGWLDAHLEWFTPHRWEEYLPRRPFRPGPLLELLGLVRLLDRSGRLPKGASLPTRALDLAERAAADPDFTYGLRRVDDLFPYHLNLIALLELLGRPQPALRSLGEGLLAAGAGGHVRPHKPLLGRLELRYFLDRGGFPAPAPLPGVDTLYRESLPALRPDVVHLTGSETYALTHVLFYVTDFGGRPLGNREETAHLRETVRILLAVHLARGSLDLVAELLLCATALAPFAGGPLVRDGWTALARARRVDGAVPSPVHRPDVLAQLTGDKAAAYLFGTCYHTTLATALAAAVRAEQGEGSRPAAGPPLPCAAPDDVRRWARHVTATRDEACAPHLAPLLVLCVQARDLPALAEVLRAAEALGRGDDPVVRSAAAYVSAQMH
ncbi:hypothetical protein AB0D04_34745 [Streptomyces sp. NPDC048483]|uniref:DUF6895 family protein n=1 Tax=Streptomyces sp. NPDC048483 TaxID=3154927 RepID=UPI00344994F6